MISIDSRAKSVAWLSIANGGMTVVLTLAWTAVLTRHLTPTEFGEFSWKWAMLSILVVLGGLGVPGYLLPRVVHARNANRHGSPHAAISLREIHVLFAVPLVWSVLLGLVGVAVLAVVQAELKLWTMALPLLVWQALAVSLARGCGFPVLAGALEGWGRYALAAIGLLVIHLFWPPTSGVELALWLITLSSMLMGAIAAQAASNEASRAFVRGPSYKRRLRSILAESIPFMISTLSMALLATSDTVVAGAVLPMEQVGYYRIAMQVSLVLAVASAALGSAFAERFAHFWQQGNADVVHESLVRLCRLSFLVASGLALLLMSLSGVIVEQLFGSVYTASLGVLWILVIYRVVESAFGPTLALMNAVGLQRYASIVTLQTAGIAIVLQLAMSHFFGVYGLATGTAVAGLSLKVRLWMKWQSVRRMSAIEP